MDTSGVLRPVGPHEPRVYWTRRAILLLAVVLVVVLFTAYACSGGGKARPAAHRTGPTPSATTTPTPAGSTPPPTGCASGQVTVAAGTDATTYPAGALPHLRATIRTTATSPCTLTRGAIGWEIVSGADTVFSTAGCAKTGGGAFTVRPNHPAVVALVWDRRRSSGCATPGAAAAPGTYQLHITVAGARSGVAVFHLTG
jgi:hypothetical protein